MTLFGRVTTYNFGHKYLACRLRGCATWKIEVMLTAVGCYITSTTVAMIRAVIAVHIHAP